MSFTDTCVSQRPGTAGFEGSLCSPPLEVCLGQSTITISVSHNQRGDNGPDEGPGRCFPGVSHRVLGNEASGSPALAD